jgi:hypothetical protein
MTNQNKDCYIINWKEGARGSFIGDLVVLLLTNNTTTIIPVKPIYGDGGGLSRHQLIDPSYDLILGYPIDHRTLVDYNKLNTDYKRWKVLWISHTQEEVLQVELTNMYKKECPTTSPNWYVEFYNNNKHLQVEGINDPTNLPPKNFKTFVNEYMNYRSYTNKEFISNNFDMMYDTLPDNVKSNIIKLNFIDITTNMPHVLNILSDFTGKEITPNVVESYKKYLLHQHLPQKYLNILYQ